MVLSMQLIQQATRQANGEHSNYDLSLSLFMNGGKVCAYSLKWCVAAGKAQERRVGYLTFVCEYWPAYSKEAAISIENFFRSPVRERTRS